MRARSLHPTWGDNEAAVLHGGRSRGGLSLWSQPSGLNETARKRERKTTIARGSPTCSGCSAGRRRVADSGNDGKGRRSRVTDGRKNGECSEQKQNLLRPIALAVGGLTSAACPNAHYPPRRARPCQRSWRGFVRTPISRIPSRFFRPWRRASGGFRDMSCGSSGTSSATSRSDFASCGRRRSSSPNSKNDGKN